MAVSTRRQASSLAAPASDAQLRHGDRLSRAEFHRRYELHPEIKKAELIEGVVHIMPSPLRFRHHGRPDHLVAGWLTTYEAATPGVFGASNATVLMDDINEPQPDQFLALASDFGGQCRVNTDDYIEGAPELVVEVAASTADVDLGAKRRVYERNGVREYVVVLTEDEHVVWLARQGEEFRAVEPDPDGTIRSRVFPGLWLNPAALLAGDMAAVLRVLAAGVASEEHGAFVERLGSPD